MAKLAAVPERRARFRERRQFAALSQPLESAGRLYYRRPDYLEKVTDWPNPERLVVDGSRLILTEANEAPRVVDLRSQPEMRTLIDGLRGPLAGDLGALQRSFTVQAGGTLAQWALELTPREPRASQFLRWIRVAGQEDVIREIRLVQANGDEQWMQIAPSS